MALGFWPLPLNVTQAEIITEDKWHQGWSEPVRQKIVSALGVQNQSVLAWGNFTPSEVITIDKWVHPFEERKIIPMRGVRY